MHIVSKLILHLFILFIPLGVLKANALEVKTVFNPDNTEIRSQNVGYLVKKNFLDDLFFHYPPVGEYFGPPKSMPKFASSISAPLISRFEPMIKLLGNYIDIHKKGEMDICENQPAKCSATFEAVNGISEKEMAAEIIKASYCFGTDPYIISSKIRKESRFDMFAKSETGAVGLTQLTAPGLKEILDQLGYRGEKYAVFDSKAYLETAIQCYVGKTVPLIFSSFPTIKPIKLRNGGLEYTPESLRLFKRWLKPDINMINKFSTEQKKTYIKRQIFVGQALLKIYLAYSKQISPQNTVLKQYESALRMFNGDTQRVQYAKDVIKFSRPQGTM